MRGFWGVLAVVACAFAGPSLAPAQDAAPAAAAAPTGTITGVVLDKGSGDPIIEATVEVLGTGRKVRTDLDGRYSVKVPPGTHQLRIFAPLFQGTRLQNVSVRAGEVTKADASLAAAVAGVEVVEVVAQASKAAETTQLLKRQKAAVVSDNISAELIKKSPDSDAAEIVTRVPAVTVKDDKFIFVRGLGERYSSALLNGSRLPSTDPEKRVVPLDLFPGEFLESLSIVKSYTPDLPGDFSGGLAMIDLREFPEQLEANVSLSTGLNSDTTFKRFRTYDGGNLDYFGFGKDERELPSIFGGIDDRLRVTRTARLRPFVEALPDNWQPESMTAPPNTGLNFNVGNSWGPLGVGLAATYSTEYKRRREIQRQFSNASDLTRFDDFVYDRSVFETRLGGLMTAAYKLSDAHKLTFRSLLNRNSSDTVLEGLGTTPNFTDPVATTQLRYEEEELAFGQLAGEHRWSWLSVDWRSAFGRTTQDVPDTRNTAYVGDFFRNEASGGTRAFQALDDFLSDSAVDFTVPFTTALPFTEVWDGLAAKFKAGAAYAYRTRDYDLRLFRYIPLGSQDLPPDLLLAPDNLGRRFTFREESQQRDLFRATHDIRGGYGMFDLPLVRDRLRLIAGVRMEYSLIELNTANQSGRPQRVRKRNVDPLPGANLVYSPRSDMNVRLSYSRSVSRPEFRELTPSIFPEPRGLRSVQGNPFLVQAQIENYDLRWEWFFSPTEVVSLGGFYKQLDQPIEQIVRPFGSSSIDSFRNALDGELKGFEFEARKDFGFIRPALANLGLTVNVAYIDATVNLKPDPVTTSLSRTLQGQSPFVVNAALDYTHPKWGSARVLYNTAGERIVAAGAFGIPDIVEQRRDQVDLVFIAPLKESLGLPLTAKFSVENVLNGHYPYTQGGFIQQDYTTGIKFGLGLSYSFQ